MYVAVETVKQYLVEGVTPEETPLLDVGGLYAYECLAEGEFGFIDGSRGRRGWVFLIPERKLDAEGIPVKVFGLRLESTLDGKTYKLMDPQKAWHGEGHFAAENDALTFKYEIEDEGTGASHDEFTAGPMAWPGKFTHTRPDGKEAHGTIKIQKISAADEDFNIRHGLGPAQIGEWARRLIPYVVPAEVLSDKSHKYLLLDIVSGHYKLGNEEDRREVMTAFLKEEPGAIIYRHPLDGQYLTLRA